MPMPLSTDHWQRALALMTSATTLRADERDAWLARVTDEEPDVAPLLNKLMNARRRVETNDVLATLPRLQRSGDAARALSSAASGSIGAHIGPFELIELLGLGGMGSVWRARYSDGRLKRDVAVKLPATSDNPAALAALRERFARERDFLAQLEHPNVARLYDTGVTEEGQPFLAMEYVAGVPIDAYCDDHKLSIKARLTLYLQVLAAVEFAHRQLVLHRDLKPGNVLVDASGQVRLLDFGVAKLLPQQAEGAAAAATSSANTAATNSAGTDLTEMAGAAITLAYAAPEQINNGRLSTATDVYALGVMLYRLLTGSQPYRVGRNTRGALEEAVLVGAPIAPGDVRITIGQATARATTPDKLSKSLRGDIGIIILKALKKNSDERYATVDAFAQDIERALNGYRILAQPDSAWYRTRKFVQRHPWAVAVSSAGAATLMMAATVAVWQGSEARTQAALAEREAARAKAVQQFLVTLFQSANPEKSRGKALTVREVLDQGAPRIQTEFANQPETEAALAGEIGAIYESLGDLDKAVTYLARKVALLDSIRKSSSADFIDANERLGRYLVNAERYVEAEAPLARALAEAAKIEPAARERRLHASMTLGLLRLRTGKIAEAQAMLTAVHDEIATMPNVTPKLAWLTDGHLAAVMSTIGDHERARHFAQSTLQRVQADSTAEALDALTAKSNLADSEFMLRHLDAAERLFQSVIEGRALLLGEQASDTLDAKNGLTRTLAAKGEFARATDLQNEVIAAAERSADPSALAYARMFQIRNEIGNGNYLAARRLADGAFAYFSAVQPNVDETTERLRALLGEIQLATGAITQAATNAREALSNQEAMFPANSPQIGQTLDVLGAIQRTQGRYSEATLSHRRALDIHVKAFGTNHLKSLRSEAYLAIARIGNGEGNAKQDFARIRSAMSQSMSATHPAQKQLVRADAWVKLVSASRSAASPSSAFFLIDF